MTDTDLFAGIPNADDSDYAGTHLATGQERQRADGPLERIMTETSARIRWEDKAPGNGDVYNVASIGYVGTVTESAFIIYTPDEAHAGWLLSVRLIPGSQFFYGDGPDELKGEAARWLAEFVASLGAVFPEPAKSESAARGTAKPPLTPNAIREVLWDAGFASYSPGEMGFSVRRSPWAWGEVVIDLVGADPSSPDARSRSLLGDYAQTLRVDGYAARIVTDAVIASAKDIGDPATSAPVAGKD